MTRHSTIVVSFSVLSLALCSGLVFAGGRAIPDSASPASPVLLAQQPAPPRPASAPVYAPPRRGTPSGEHRVGGGTRAGKSFPVIAVLAPDHTGLTLNDQPALYWFVSAPVQWPIEIIVTDDKSVTPILETQLQPPASAGIQRIRLADYGIHLTPGTRYEWSVAFVIDNGHRSLDVFASGSIERVEKSAVTAALDQAAPLEPPQRYAAAGLWYDAVMSLSELIEAKPTNRELRRQRASLLEQVGLGDASRFDRAATGGDTAG